MKIVKGRITQGAADVSVALKVDTGLGITDQRTLWELVAIDICWPSCWLLASVGQFLAQGVLTRKDDKSSFLDDEVIGGVTWAGVAGTVGQGGVTLIDMVQRMEFVDRPLVANSSIWFVNHTMLTGLANVMEFKLYVEERKVTELEFLKAQTGYCIC